MDAIIFCYVICFAVVIIMKQDTTNNNVSCEERKQMKYYKRAYNEKV